MVHGIIQNVLCVLSNLFLTVISRYILDQRKFALIAQKLPRNLIFDDMWSGEGRS